MGKDVLRFYVEKYNDSPFVVFFSSYLGDSRRDSFEWWNRRHVAKNVAYMDDLTDSWYHYCLDELTDILREVIDGPALMVGVSAGAYISLIMADRFNACSMALNPQTTLIGYAEGDRNWMKRCKEIAENTSHKDILDIQGISGKQHHVYYSKLSEIDSFHAERMNVTLHPYPCAVHGLGKWMSENGTLETEILRRISDIK